MDAERFIEVTQGELALRKKELTAIKLSLVSPESDGKEWIRRAGVALAYAHWEGFVKATAQRYVKHVNSLGILTEALQLGLQTLTVLSHFKQAAQSGNRRFLAEMLKSMDDRRTDVFGVRPEKVVDTESNLSSVVFADLLASLGLGLEDIDVTRTAFIDAKLVHARNQVAHGELVQFPTHEVVEKIDGVVQLLDAFTARMLDAIEAQDYMLPVPGQPEG